MGKHLRNIGAGWETIGGKNRVAIFAENRSRENVV